MMETEKKKRRTQSGIKPRTPNVSQSGVLAVDPQELGQVRYARIQERAYLKAEQEGFRRDPVDYWLSAEMEIDAQPVTSVNEEPAKAASHVARAAVRELDRSD